MVSVLERAQAREIRVHYTLRRVVRVRCTTREHRLSRHGGR